MSLCELTGLSQLQDIAIYHMIKRGGQINLPSGCSWHVDGDQLEISSLYWETNARSGQVKTLNFEDWVHHSEMPPFVSWSGCTYLFWDMGICNLGRLSRPVEFLWAKLAPSQSAVHEW